MNNLLEIGEVGILRDIPFEMTQLSNQNQLLSNELRKYKTYFWIIIAAGAVYIMYRLLETSYENMDPKE